MLSLKKWKRDGVLALTAMCLLTNVATAANLIHTQVGVTQSTYNSEPQANALRTINDAGDKNEDCMISDPPN